MKKNILITGVSGYLGSVFTEYIEQHQKKFGHIIGVDLRPPEKKSGLAKFQFIEGSVTNIDLAAIFKKYKIHSVVHLASIVTPPPGMSRETIHEIEVGGTRRIIDACITAGVRQFVVTSSGAAYGYYADNPTFIKETDAIRGNPEFAYSDHKRQVEEMLAEYRNTNPGLKQLILRPGTILGEKVKNQITNLFEKSVVLDILGADSRFVFIYDKDVAKCIYTGIVEKKDDIYNLAGDGTLNMKEIAAILKKPYLPLPAFLVQAALAILKLFKLSQYGPEQVNFLRYRPVLDNTKVKKELCQLSYSTEEVFKLYLKSRSK